MAGVSTGANAAEADLRRRNVPGSQAVAAATPVQPEREDKKKQERPAPSVLQILDQWESVIVPVLFTAIALFTRLYKIGISDIVTWDEAQQVPPPFDQGRARTLLTQFPALANSEATTCRVPTYAIPLQERKEAKTHS